MRWLHVLCLVALSMSLGFVLSGTGARAAEPASGAGAEIAALEAQLGSRLGIALVDGRGETLLVHRPGERFALCSTFKLALAAAVLERVEAGELSLGREVRFDATDMVPYAPVTETRLDLGSMTVEELARAAVEVSDNVAANLLLELVGGPAGFTAFVRRHGDEVTRLDRIEPELNENAPGDPRDTTSPAAMAELVRALLLGDALEPGSRDTLAQWVRGSRTGAHRIRAGLPAGWSAGDKTGSCGSAYNDVAVVWPTEEAGIPPFVLAVYVDRPTAPKAEVEAAIARVGALAASGSVAPPRR